MSISLDSLKTEVRAAVSGSSFSLATARLDSREIDALSAELFPGATMRLEGVRPPAVSPDGGTITVGGTGVDLPFAGMAVEIQFYLSGDDATFALTATGGAGWRLPQSFPVLARSVLAGFAFLPSAPPRLHIASRGRAGAPAALTFDGLLDLDGASAGLAGLVGRGELPLSGSAVVRKNGAVLSGITLTAPPSGSVDLGIVKVEGLTFTVGSDLTYNFLEDSYSAVPYVRLGAHFPFSAQGQSYSLPVCVRVADFGRDLRFSADLTSAVAATREEISRLTNKVGLGHFAPPDLSLEGLVTLEDFFFDLKAGAPPKVTLVGVGVGGVGPWKFLHLAASDKDLQAENVRLAFRLRDPFGARQPWLGLSGDVRLGDAGVLEISSSYPDFRVEAALKEGKVLRFDELIRDFVGADASIPPINVYALLLKAEADQFSLLADIGGFWPLGDSPIGVEGVRVEIEKRGDEMRVAAAGTFSVAGVDVLLSARYQGAARGWIFEGSTGPGQALGIGELVAELAERFGDIALPSAVSDLVVENLTVTIDTGRRVFTFSCAGKFRADDTEVDIRVLLTVTNVNDAYTKLFDGKLTIGGHEFTIHFAEDASSDFFVATYQPDVRGRVQDVKHLVASVSSAVAGYVPRELTIELKDLVFAYLKPAQAVGTGTTAVAPGKFILGMDIGTGINLSKLPLVGQEFPKDETLGVDDLQILFVSQDMTEGDVTRFNRVLPARVTRLPVPSPPQTGGGDASGTTAADVVALRQGFNVSARMNFGGTRQTFVLPAVGAAPTTPATTQLTNAPANATYSAADSALWFPLEKSFGPVYFEKVGVQYRDKKIWFLLSASLTAAGLSLSLDGLAFGGALDEFTTPSFYLRGVGVAYRSGPVEVAGAFLRRPVTQDGVSYDEYEGAALIKTEQLTLSAVGSYAYTQGHPSLFVYALLDHPIGGPSFFFVTGLAAGFGFNRALVAPPAEQVAQFPLVADAAAGARTPDDPERKLQQSRDALSKLLLLDRAPARVGSYFLAAGIRFNSFKLVDSFALLTVNFGRRFEIDLLGLSTLVVPTPVAGQPAVTPLAEVQMALKASYVPDEGFLGVSAQLTPASYILSRDCHLTGGFAFWSWLSGEHEGDFVLTLGGYHPGYKVPAHYPKVPRLGLNWRVDDNISIKGDIYFAMTASALMAGGSLHATWEGDDLKAWFNAGANFIIAWQPYRYEASMYVDISVAYTYHCFGTHHLNLNVGADLQLRGPEFSGRAHIKLSVISFDITFGQDSSEGAAEEGDWWKGFKASFLPEDSEVCSLAVKDGLLKDSGAGWVVNPKTFTLVSNSVIPSTEAYAGKVLVPGAGDKAKLGIAPRGGLPFVARHTVTITREKDGAPTPCEDRFDFSPVEKKVPAALWGRSSSPSLNGPAFVEGALAGLEIRPKVKPRPDPTASIDPGVLPYSAESVPAAFKWETFSEFAPEDAPDDRRRQTVKEKLADATVAAARAQLLSLFGLETAVTADGATAEALLAAPLIGRLAT